MQATLGSPANEPNPHWLRSEALLQSSVRKMHRAAFALLSGLQIQLFDRHTWAQGRYLHFDLDDAFGRRESAAFEAMALLLGATTLAPDAESEEPLHERLLGQSHRFTHGVSGNTSPDRRLPVHHGHCQRLGSKIAHRKPIPRALPTTNQRYLTEPRRGPKEIDRRTAVHEPLVCPSVRCPSSTPEGLMVRPALAVHQRRLPPSGLQH